MSQRITERFTLVAALLALGFLALVVLGVGRPAHAARPIYSQQSLPN